MNRPALSLLVGCVLAGCTSVQAPAGSRHSYTIPHVLRYATEEDIVGLNPDLQQQTTVSYMSSLTMAWLLKYGQDSQPIPELATEVPTQQNGGISRDGLAITYHLRRGVRWSDGAPFDADDVVFSFRTVLNPATNVVGRDGFDLITKLDEPDKYTVVVHLKQKYAAFAETFFSTAGANPCVLPKHLLGNLPNINHAAYNALPVGIGPFKYAEWKRGDSVTMVRNPDYFRGRPKLERIVFKIVPDENTVFAQLESHEVDLWIRFPSLYYDRLKTIPGIDVLRRPSYQFTHIDFQTTHPGLDDPRVRRALRLAVNRPEIVAKNQHGIGFVQDDPFAPTSAAYDANVPTDPFDLARAAKLLDAAGWRMGRDGVRTKNGHALNLTFATEAGIADLDQMIELVRANWQRIGVKFSVFHYPAPLLFAPYSDGGIVYGGKWDLVTFVWGGDALGDYSSLYACDQIPPKGQNVLRYCNPTASAAMAAFKREYDPIKRRQLAAAIQLAIAKDAPTIVVFINEDLFAYNSDLTGFRPSQLGTFDDFMNVDI